LQGFEPRGTILEIGAGSGAMAAEVLAHYEDVTMTVTDFDQAMVDTAWARLGRFDGRASVAQADATALPFADETFDVVLSCIMLHHTVEWEKALAESVRVLRPGGHIVGYDLLSRASPRPRHSSDGGGRRMMTLRELRSAVDDLPIERATFTSGLGGFIVRFRLRVR
jgi:ubiquinone/menaquinone biosynthesis C-methylase UbiE